MKILRIIARLNIGGPSIHVTNLNEHIPNSVLVYGGLAEGEGSMEYFLEEKCLDNIKLYSLGREISPFNDLKTLFSLIRIIHKEKPDIVHTHTAKAGFVGRLAAKICGVKKVYHTFHGHVFHSYFSPAKTKFFIILERIMAKLSTKIVVISQTQKEDLLKYNICKENKIEIIPLGFDLSKFLTIKRPENSKRIGIVGRIVPIKNHKLFLEIAKLLPEYQFEIIGDGELRSELELIAPENVKFKGFNKNMPEVYQNLDLLLLTSHNEGTPVAVIEAVASGVPVISTDVGGVKDILKDIPSCRVLPPDPKEFARYIPIHLDIAVTETERNTINNRFSVARLVKDIKELYQL